MKARHIFMKIKIFKEVLDEIRENGKGVSAVYGFACAGAAAVLTASAEKGAAAGWIKIGALCADGGFEAAAGLLSENDGDKTIIEIENDYYGKLTSRTSSILNGLLKGKRVGFVGTGASINLIKSCARSGVDKFSLWDFDIVEEANIGRTAYELKDCGMSKTASARRHILEINPFCDVKIFDGDFMALAEDEIKNEFKECDVIVMGTDAQKVQLRGNEIGYALGKKMVFPGFYNKAAGGEIVVVTPGGPCYKCIVPSRFSEGENSTEAAENGVDGENRKAAADLKGESGLIFDCDHLDSMVGKIVCALICEGDSPALRGLYEFVRTHGLILSKHASDFNIDGADYFRDCLGDNPLFYAYQTMWLDTAESRSEKCGVCGKKHENIEK